MQERIPAGRLRQDAGCGSWSGVERAGGEGRCRPHRPHHVQVRAFCGDLGKQAVVAGRPDDLDQPVGSTLCRTAKVLRAVGDEEGLECGAEQRRRLRVEEALDGGHAVEQRGEGEMPSLVLLLGLAEGSVRIGDEPQMAPCGADGRDVALRGETREHRGSVALVLLGQVAHRTFDSTDVVVRHVAGRQVLDGAIEQSA